MDNKRIVLITVMGIAANALVPCRATAADDPRMPAAMLFGAPIYAEEMQPPGLEQVKHKIWSALRARFCAEHDCEPTEEEYRAFEEGFRRLMTRNPPPGWESRESAISAEEYERLTQELAQQRAAPGERRQEIDQAAASLTALRNQKLGDMTKDVGMVWIREWKFNRALYRQYGGQVIWQQAGLEPLDAYRTWLEEHQRNGSFVLIDPELQTLFWLYFTVGHVTVDERFLAETGLSDPFEKPWWELPQR